MEALDSQPQTAIPQPRDLLPYALETVEGAGTEKGAPAGGLPVTRAEPSSLQSGAPFVAFLAARAQRDRSRLRRRSLAVGIAVVLHGALAVAFVINDFMRVDELTAPVIRVSFLSAPMAVAAPPLAAPPPAKANRARTVGKPLPVPTVQPPAVSALADPPASVPDTSPAEDTVSEAPGAIVEALDGEGSAEDSTAAAVGAPGGVPGGSVGGAGAAVAAPPSLPLLDVAQRRQFLDRYLSEIMRKRIDQNRFYPPEAEEAELEATVIVRVVVDAAGRLMSVSVVKGDHVPVLARAALQTIHRSQPFPPPPSVLGDRVQVDVALNYKLAL